MWHAHRLLTLGMLSAIPLLWVDFIAADDGAVPYQLTDINPAGIGGTILIHGGDSVGNALRAEFVRAAGGESAKIVVISLGQKLERSDTDRAQAADDVDAAESEDPAELWKNVVAASVDHLQLQGSEQLSAEATLALVQTASGVWLEEGQWDDTSWASEEFAGALRQLLDRGGLIGGTRAVALTADRYTVEVDGATTTHAGWGLLPQVAILQADEPPESGYVGVHIEPDTVVFFHQRTVGVVGNGCVNITPHYHVAQEEDTLHLRDGQIADLTALRRMATLGPRFRRGEEEPPACEAPGGSLLIVGGGGFTSEMRDRFIELAGGGEAKIVVIPSAEENPQLEGRGDVQEFLDAGAAQVHVLHTTDRAVADSDEFIAPLQEATGIWFGGGRQWRFLDAYAGTKTEAAMRAVLERGGVIGGSSAGATIQGDYLVRGNPLGNIDMMSAGYEDGFCYLPGCAIDQHFTQRARHRDMVLFKQHLPRMLGIGIDETTAILVTGHMAEVLGEGKVAFFDGDAADEAEQSTEVSAGQTYDLVERRILEPASP